MKKRKESEAEKKARHTEIERLFKEINLLVSQGKLEEALDLRFEADKLRIFW